MEVLLIAAPNGPVCVAIGGRRRMIVQREAIFVQPHKFATAGLRAILMLIRPTLVYPDHPGGH